MFTAVVKVQVHPGSPASAGNYTHFFTYLRQVLWFCIRVAAVIQGGPWSSGTVRAFVHFDSVTAAKAASLSLRFTTALGVLQGIVLGTFSGY